MEGMSRDEQDLARFGYKQELKRSLGVFSSFAVAFSLHLAVDRASSRSSSSA